MPVYTYWCDCGEKFDELRAVDQRSHCLCPKCGFAAPLVIDTAAKLDIFGMAMSDGFPTAVRLWAKDRMKRSKA